MTTAQKTFRKFRKLVRDPQRFAYDAVQKRLRTKRPAPAAPKVLATYSNTLTYSVVTAVYGVADYLDKFIGSIVTQSLDFERRIELIMVDDGSLDTSAAIIERWIDRFPRNIKLVRKENGGQASARNLGLKHARAPWVTFMDPDDFVSQDYFAHVDDFLARAESEVSAICCRTVFYFEDIDEVRDTHPLRGRFNKPEKVVDFLRQQDVFYLQTNTAFLRRNVIEEGNLSFHHDVKPTFEDAKFFNEYLLSSGSYRVALLARPTYMYRKRASKDSSLDTCWRKPEQYTSKIEKGYIALAERYRLVHGQVPLFIQNMILYELSWYLGHLSGRDDRIDFLTDEESATFEDVLGRLLRLLDVDVLLANGRIRPSYKVGLLTRFLKLMPLERLVYVHERSPNSTLVELCFFGTPDERDQLEVCVNGIRVVPTFQKNVLHTLNRAPFFLEKRFFLDAGQRGTISLSVNGQPVKLRMGRRTYAQLDFAAIPKAVPAETPSIEIPAKLWGWAAQLPQVRKRFEGAWLFMDRDTQADDNAEHLYRWVRANTRHADRCYFVLRRTSHDWERLAREGFRLIEFGSLEHRAALLNAEWLISSHADEYVVNYLSRTGYGSLLRHKFAFLQHGITKDNLSDWLNKKSFDLFVTSTPPEYDSIVNGPYRSLSNREVVLTGFPRHDRLREIDRSTPDKDLVVIMPTWRNYLLGKRVGLTSSAQLINNFDNSSYYKHWQEITADERLVTAARAAGKRVVFFPHSYMQPYLSHFRLAPGIELMNHGTGSMQQIFARSALLLTDYSSVAFEVAMLGRPVVYFQFDVDEFWKSHTYRKGYFDYVRDGFGPVEGEAQAAVDRCIEVLQSGCEVPSSYRTRAESVFTNHDGRCCERVYRELVKRSAPDWERMMQAERAVAE